MTMQYTNRIFSNCALPIDHQVWCCPNCSLRNHENSVFCRCVSRIADRRAREATLYPNLEKLLQTIEREPLPFENRALPARSSLRANSPIQHAGYTLSSAGTVESEGTRFRADTGERASREPVEQSKDASSPSSQGNIPAGSSASNPSSTAIEQVGPATPLHTTSSTRLQVEKDSTEKQVKPEREVCSCCRCSAAASCSADISQSASRAASGYPLLQSNVTPVKDSLPLLHEEADRKYREIRASYDQTRHRYRDEEFPPTDKSILVCQEETAKDKKYPNFDISGKFEWIRPEQIREPSNWNYKDWAVFRENPQASDIKQGILGI